MRQFQKHSTHLQKVADCLTNVCCHLLSVFFTNVPFFFFQFVGRFESFQGQPCFVKKTVQNVHFTLKSDKLVLDVWSYTKMLIFIRKIYIKYFSTLNFSRDYLSHLKNYNWIVGVAVFYAEKNIYLELDQRKLYKM